MKFTELGTDDIVSIERVVRVELPVDEDGETIDSFADGSTRPITYAMDSKGRIWRLDEGMSGVLNCFTEHDGMKRHKRKRVSV